MTVHQKFSRQGCRDNCRDSQSCEMETIRTNWSLRNCDWESLNPIDSVECEIHNETWALQKPPLLWKSPILLCWTWSFYKGALAFWGSHFVTYISRPTVSIELKFAESWFVRVLLVRKVSIFTEKRSINFIIVPAPDSKFKLDFCSSQNIVSFVEDND